MTISMKYNPKHKPAVCSLQIKVTCIDNMNCLITLSLAKYFIIVFIIKKINTLIGKPN